jgi:hypothetical protein
MGLLMMTMGLLMKTMDLLVMTMDLLTEHKHQCQICQHFLHRCW